MVEPQQSGKLVSPMAWALFVGWLHLLGFGLASAGVWMRGRGFEKRDLGLTFVGDNVWGLSALVSISTGLWRAFGPHDKGSAYYLQADAFHLKMTVFGLLFLLELWPMVTLIRWRTRQQRGQAIDLAPMARFAIINRIQIGLLLLMPFFAMAMARGVRFIG